MQGTDEKRRHDDGFAALAARWDYPVFVVTAASGAERSGCLVGFLTQTSIVPPRVLVCVSRHNTTARVAERALWLAVHVVREGDEELARWFGGATADEGVDKFLDVEWDAGPGGVPVLRGLDVFVGRVVNRIPYLGDHVGHLLAADGMTTVDEARADRPQLRYQQLAGVQAGHPPDPAQDPEPDALPGVARDPSSIVSVEQSLRAGGFPADFRSGEGGTVVCATCGQTSDAARFAVHQLRRLEGASDPDELMLVAAVGCPVCGARGTLLLTYGPTATAEDAAILERLPQEPRRVRTDPTDTEVT